VVFECTKPSCLSGEFVAGWMLISLVSVKEYCLLLTLVGNGR
jgi:hypothetical protein